MSDGKANVIQVEDPVVRQSMGESGHCQTRPRLPDANRSQSIDESLVLRCLNGDNAAWSALMDRYRPLIGSIVRRAGLDDHCAADVMQTVFARLVVHLPRLAQPGRLQAWLVTTTKRESWLQCRIGHRTVSMTALDDAEYDRQDLEIIDRSPIAEEALASRQQLDQLREGLCLLDGRCRDLLEWLFPQDEDPLSYAEIARRLEAPVGSIGPTRTRCLDKLRRMVQDLSVIGEKDGPNDGVASIG